MYIHNPSCIACMQVSPQQLTMMALFSVVCYLLLVTGIVQCGWDDGNVGVDRPGGDFPGMPVPLNTSDDHVHACAQLCQKTTGCVAWAFNQPFCSSSNSTQPPECYLKSSVPSQKLDLCRVSHILSKLVLFAVVFIDIWCDYCWLETTKIFFSPSGKY